MSISINSDFTAIFNDAWIPHPIYGIPDIAITYSAAEIKQLAILANELIHDIAAGKQVRCYFDNDGTLFPFTSNPSDTHMDRGGFEGLVRLSQYENFLATSLTGRDVREAADHMLTPGYLVRDSRGRVLNPEGDRTLRFAITGSHGVENLDLNRTVTKFDFGAEASSFISAFQQRSAALRQDYPGIHIEDKKHGAVGINVRTIEGDSDMKASAYARALALLQEFEDSPLNPRHAVTGKRIFRIKREGTEELELRPLGFGKDFGILHFGNPDKTVRTIFLGDSLKQPDGTDLDAAALINNKDRFDHGTVIMVRNGRFEPEMEGPARPRVVLANPTMLGNFLCHIADQVELRRPLLDHTNLNANGLNPPLPA